jgi:hypothetical protein
MATILDSGALIGVERSNRSVISLLAEIRRREDIEVNPNVLAQVWRGGSGKQATLSRFLTSVKFVVLEPSAGLRTGRLLGDSATTDVVDASVAAQLRAGDTVITSDPEDLIHLINTLGIKVAVVEV